MLEAELTLDEELWLLTLEELAELTLLELRLEWELTLEWLDDAEDRLLELLLLLALETLLELYEELFELADELFELADELLELRELLLLLEYKLLLLLE